MKKIFFTLVLLVGMLQLDSCKEDDLPPPAVVSFSRVKSSIAESQDTARIVLILDKAAPGDIVVNYSLGGSATLNEDYQASGALTIPAGAIDGIISLRILNDENFEFDPEIADFLGESVVTFAESVVITLTGITGNGRFSDTQEELVHTLAILEDDSPAQSLVIELSWDVGNGTAGDVDMDMYIFRIDLEEAVLLTGSDQAGTEFEGIIITELAPDATYGLAFRYFEGTSDQVNFTVKFIAKDGQLPDGALEKTYTSTYTLQNINAEANVQIVQTFAKQGKSYLSFSEIEVPESGSRRRSLVGSANKGETSSSVVY